MNPITWLTVTFMTPLVIAALAYGGMHIYLGIRNRRKQHELTITSTVGRDYSLYLDMAGTRITAWYVYGLAAGQRMTAGQLERGVSSDALFRAQCMEIRINDWDGTLELVHDRYLAFKVGGLYHSLYDTREQSLLVHEDSLEQFSAWIQRQDDPEAITEDDYIRWITRHLHEPIEKILAEQGQGK